MHITLKIACSVALVLALGLALTGCGGSSSNGVHYLTFVLNVSQANANPLADCTIWLDGIAQHHTTNNFFSYWSGGPHSWDGYPYNWRLNHYEVVMPDWASEQSVPVWVTKPGWRGQQTDFSVYDTDSTNVYGRATFVMERAPASAAQSATDHGKYVPSERWPARK